MSRLLNEDVGQTVGYRVRMDSRVGPKTRIELVTEGVLIKKFWVGGGYGFSFCSQTLVIVRNCGTR